MTIGENVAFGLQMKKTPKSEIMPRVREALELVRLPGYEQRKPRQLSGGQQQRVALARALVNRPEVLLLDEPLGALDLKLRKEMQLELKKLQREVGITFVFVTHDQEEALTMSDRIAVMSQGVALQVGDANEIYEHPNCRFVADFIGDTNFLDGKIAEKDGERVKVDVCPMRPPVWAITPQPVSPGSAVSVTVRPEKMHLRPTGGAGQRAHRAGEQHRLHRHRHPLRRGAARRPGGAHPRAERQGRLALPGARGRRSERLFCAEAAARVLTE
jgi:spermidine/putrescine transport system ATP-binding protein